MTTPSVEPLKVGFLHEGLFPEGAAFHQSIGRAIELRFDEAVAMVVSGEIADAKSTIGLLLADRRLRGLDSVVK